MKDLMKIRGTHVIVKRGDYLLLCGLAGVTDEKKVLEIDNRSERINKDKKKPDLIERVLDYLSESKDDKGAKLYQDFGKEIMDYEKPEKIIQEVIEDIDKQISNIKNMSLTSKSDEGKSQLKSLKGYKEHLIKKLEEI